MTAEQCQAIVNMMYHRALLAERQGLWNETYEDGFVTGALTAFLACGNEADIPAHMVMKVSRLFPYLESQRVRADLQALPVVAKN